MNRSLLIFILIILIIPGASLGAYDHDWNILLGLNFELPDIAGTTAAITTKDSIGFRYQGSWNEYANIKARLGLGFDGNLRFTVSSGFKFSVPTFQYGFYPKLDTLAFFGRYDRFGYTVGRQVLLDPAVLIVNAPVDGILATADFGRHIFSAGFAYTGLTFKSSSRYYVSPNDLSSNAFELSEGRLIEYLSWEMPSLADWMNLKFMFLASQDVSGSAAPFHSMYLEFVTNGFLAKGRFLYDLSLVGQYGTGSVSTLAGIGRLRMSWIPEGPSRLGVELTASSGDTWADRGEYLLNSPASTSLNQYLPLSTVSTRGYVIEFEVGNLASLGLFYSRKPRSNYSWELRTTTFLRMADGPVSTFLVKAPTDGGVGGAFLGQELLASWLWRPRYDFGWNIKLGLMYTGSPVMLESFLQDYYLGIVPVMFRTGFDFSWSF